MILLVCDRHDEFTLAYLNSMLGEIDRLKATFCFFHKYDGKDGSKNREQRLSITPLDSDPDAEPITDAEMSNWSLDNNIEHFKTSIHRPGTIQDALEDILADVNGNTRKIKFTRNISPI